MYHTRLNVLLNGFAGLPAGRHGAHGIRMLEQALAPFRLGSCIAVCGEGGGSLQLNTDIPVWTSSTPLEEVRWENISPLDADLIEAMSECEAVCLKMMDRRAETQGKVLPYEARRRLYLMALRFWSHHLREKGINLFLSASMPHRVHQYVMYSLCKLWSIRTFFFQELGFIPDALFLMEDWRDPAPELTLRYEKLRSEFSVQRPANCHLPIATCQLPDRFERYFREHTAKESDPEPWYRPKGLSLSPLWWWRRVFSILKRDPRRFVARVFPNILRWFTRAYYHDFVEERRRKRRARTLLRFYDAHTIIPDLAKPFIYVALHYQPECSTCPMGGSFVDQLLGVQLLAACLPDNVLLYVKEHPNQGEMSRDLHFYRDLLKVRNVRLIPRDSNTFRLTERCIAVATVTGTVGFEALFRQKPVLMFGRRFYEHASGVFPVSSCEDVQQALGVILRGGGAPDLTDVRVFLKALEESCIEGYADPDYRPVSRLSDEENAQNVARALCEKIRESFPESVA